MSGRLGLAVLALLVAVGAGAPAVARPAEQSGPALGLVGQLGGGSRAVAAQGTVAYAGVGPRLVAFDLAAADAPRPVGQSEPLGDVIEQVVLSGSYAYVADDFAGLHVLDVSDPARPRRIGGYDPPGRATGVAVDGGRIYVADGTSGLRILDAADPRRPTDLGRFDALAVSVAASGRYAYVGSHNLLRVVDVADPASPREVGQLAVPTSRFAGGIFHVAVVGARAYLSASGLRIVDVSDPTRPTQLGWLDMPSQSVAVDGRYAYVAGATNGLRVVDVGDPTHPTEVASAVPSPRSAWAVAVAERGVVVADAGFGVRLFDVASPTAPAERGAHRVLELAYGIAADGTRVYVTDLYPPALWVLDASSPATPTVLGRFDFSAEDEVSRPFPAGPTRVLIGDGGSLRVVDVTDPGAARQLARIELGVFAGVQVVGDRAYVSTATDLRVLDLSDPANPRQLGATPAASAGRLVVAGDHAYVALGGSGLEIFSLADPIHPVSVARLDTPGYAGDVVVEGGRAYLADSSGGLRVYDVADPARPREIATYPASRSAFAVALACPDVFLVDFVAGNPTGSLRLLRGDPTALQEVSSYPLTGEELFGDRIALGGGRVYAPYRTMGLLVLRPTGPTAAPPAPGRFRSILPLAPRGCPP